MKIKSALSSEELMEQFDKGLELYTNGTISPDIWALVLTGSVVLTLTLLEDQGNIAKPVLFELLAKISSEMEKLEQISKEQ